MPVDGRKKGEAGVEKGKVSWGRDEKTKVAHETFTGDKKLPKQDVAPFFFLRLQWKCGRKRLNLHQACLSSLAQIKPHFSKCNDVCGSSSRAVA